MARDGLSRPRFASGELVVRLHGKCLGVIAFAFLLFAMCAVLFVPTAAYATSSGTLSFNQANINSVGKQAKNSQACLCYAYAYSQTITSGKTHYWYEYDGNGGKSEKSAYGKGMGGSFTYMTKSGTQNTLRAAYDNLSSGRPVIIYVTQKNGGQHWVTLVGYKNVANANNLTTGNFLMLDPVYGASKSPEYLNCRGYSVRNGNNNVRVSKSSVSFKAEQPTHTHNYSNKSYSFYNNVNHTVTSKCSCGATKTSRENCSFAWSGLTNKCTKCGTEYVRHDAGEYYIKNATNIFKGDNPNSGTQTTIPAGTVVKVTNVKNSSWGRWVGMVTYSGKTGYIHLSDAMYNGSAGKHTFKNGKCTQCGVTQAGSKAGVYKAKAGATLYYKNVYSSTKKTLTAGAEVTINAVGTSSAGYYWGYTPDGYVVSMDNLSLESTSAFGTPITIADGDYYVRLASDTSYVWDIYSGSKDNSTKLTIYPSNSTAAQKFRFKRQSNGSYTIMNLNSGKYIDASGYGKTNGTNVIQYTLGSNQGNQQWYIEQNSNGTYSFRGVNSNLYLHIYNGNISKSNPIHLWQGCTSTNAQWYMEPLDGNIAAGNMMSVEQLSNAYTYSGKPVTPSPQVKKLIYTKSSLRVPTSGTAGAAYWYAKLCSVRAGHSYIVTAQSVKQLSGNKLSPTLIAHNFTTNKSVSDWVSLKLSNTEQTVIVKATADGTLLLYPNTPGSCKGTAAQFTNIKVYEVLESGTDYTLSYENNNKAGTATVKVAGKGSFKGSLSRNFTIIKTGSSDNSGQTQPSKPSTPKITSIVGGNGSFTIKTNEQTAVSKYEVSYFSTAIGSWKTVTYTGSSLNATVTGLKDGYYTVKVRACASGSGKDVWSDWTLYSGTTVKAASTSVAKPDTPRVTSLVGGTGSFTIQADKQSNVTKYEIQCYCSKTDKWETAIYSGSYLNTKVNVLNDGIYVVKVRACTTNGTEAAYSDWSESKTVTVKAASNVTTPKPKTPKIKNLYGGRGQFTVKSNKQKTVTKYEVRYWVSQDIWGRAHDDTDAKTVESVGTRLNTTIENLDRFVYYSVQIRACITTADGDAYSDWTAVKTVHVG